MICATGSIPLETISQDRRVDETPALREALDRLYRSPPSEFVRLRTELARSLAAKGDRETAHLVKAARKPDRIAAALNAAVLDDATPIEAVFAAYDAAEREQRRNNPERWRDLVTDYREGVQAATHAIVEHASLGPDATTSRHIAQALSAAAADEAARKRILSGRVTTLDQDTDPLAALGLRSQPDHPRSEAPAPTSAHTAGNTARTRRRDETARTNREDASAKIDARSCDPGEGRREKGGRARKTRRSGPTKRGGAGGTTL
jgi:hypothetical protein